jgi:hypothetical protein
MAIDKRKIVGLLQAGYKPREGGPGKRYIVFTRGTATKSAGLQNTPENWTLIKQIQQELDAQRQQEEIEAREDQSEEQAKKKEPTAEAIVSAAVALPTAPKPADIQTQVKMSDAVKPSLETASWEYNLQLHLGRMVRYELQADVKLSEEERRDPEKAARAYLSFIQTLLKFREDAKAYDRLMAENVVARGAIKELQTALNQFKEAFEACAASMCAECRKKALYLLAMKAATKPREVTP